MVSESVTTHIPSLNRYLVSDNGLMATTELAHAHKIMGLGLGLGLQVKKKKKNHLLRMSGSL